MKKRILTLILALVMLISAVPFSMTVYGEGTEQITVYFSLCKYGEIVSDKNGDPLANAEITLSGKESYNLNDVFYAAHAAYHEDGADGYESSNGEWGLSVDKLWGDTSFNFGYQVNGGTETVYGLDHTVENGDYVDAAIYKNFYPDTEGYATFDTNKIDLCTDEVLELTLSYVSGYDESYNMIFSPCDNATIVINGTETEIKTDENGKAEISLCESGKYIISAKKTKILNETTVPAITAPICVADVEMRPTDRIIHNIAKKYTNSNLIDAGVNLAWILADMAVYEELFPDADNILTQQQKDSYFQEIVKNAQESTTPGNMAKAIIALRALGYDAKNVYTKDFKTLDIPEKLTSLIDSEDTAVTNIYTLPYVIIALSQGENYATNEQMEYLINSVVSSKELWQSTSDGTDALTPIILALAPYYNTSAEIKDIIDETVEILKSEQREDGLIDGYEGYESASTGLAICALSSIGIDSNQTKNGENSLIDGLMSTADEDLSAFANAFATEQGFRGLLSLKLLEQNKRMYDFFDYPMNEANASWSEKCPVIFSTSPENTTVIIEGKTEKEKNCFDLEEGIYTYSATCSGYMSSTGTVEITAEDVLNRTATTVNVFLSAIYSGGGMSSSSFPAKEDKEESAEDKKPEETIKNSFTEETFPDVKEDDWYYDSVKYAYENSLFNGTENGFEPNASMTRAMLVTVLYRLESPEKITEENPFSDISGDEWYSEGVVWAAENNIINGVSENEFAPDSPITREQLALIMYRYALLKGDNVSEYDETDILSYEDFNEISEYAKTAMKYVNGAGILKGRTGNLLTPKGGASRAEVATILMRFIEMKR